MRVCNFDASKVLCGRYFSAQTKPANVKERYIGFKREHLSENSFRSVGAIICIENRWNARTQTYTEDSLFCSSFDEESCLGDL